MFLFFVFCAYFFDAKRDVADVAVQPISDNEGARRRERERAKRRFETGLISLIFIFPSHSK